MAPNPALKKVIDAKTGDQAKPHGDLQIAKLRSTYAGLWQPWLTGAEASIESTDRETWQTVAGPVPVAIYRPRSDEPRPVILYFHGGGYVQGGIEESRIFCGHLAQATGRLVVSVDYRLAPEHPYPAALDDCYAVTQHAYHRAAAMGAVQDDFAVSGEGAGGNLAAVVCHQAKADRWHAITKQVLIQPVLDFTLSFPSMAMAADQCWVTREDLAWCYSQYYASGANPKNPSISPLWAHDFSQLPEALIIAAEYDTLRDEAEAYGQKLRDHGVIAHNSCYEGMIHGFSQMGGLVTEARQAIEEIAAFLKAPVPVS